MTEVSVRVLRLSHGAGLELPHYRTPGAAGMDLLAAVPEDAPLADELFTRPLLHADMNSL